jgi:hypothetical protein
MVTTIEQPTLHYLTRSVRRRGGYVQTGFWEMMTKVPDRLSATPK